MLSRRPSLASGAAVVSYQDFEVVSGDSNLLRQKANSHAMEYVCLSLWAVKMHKIMEFKERAPRMISHPDTRCSAEILR
jgi:hypothetical protein